ncbi:MAG: discoidin domain-containing protein [Clostridia bacterium]|nr:discoidin domain-containing protein [Clostridia bacterium]
MMKRKQKWMALLCAAALTAFTALGFAFRDKAATSASGETTEYGVDLAFGRRVASTEAESQEVANSYAVDGKANTRYASKQTDDAFYYIDLGNTEKINKIVIDWEAAYAAEYKVQLSMDAVTWTDVAKVQKTEKSKDVITFPYYLETKFVKFQGVKRATDYGYSFYSFEVYGPKNLATDGATVTEVSSYENEEKLKKEYVLDNDATTRWASSVADGQYVLIDLGKEKTFDTVKIRWEVSFARRYEIYAASGIQMPERDGDWGEAIFSTDEGLGEVESWTLPDKKTAQFLKIELIQRETMEEIKKTGRLPWASTFSFYSFELFDWSNIKSVPLGNVMEFSKNSPAWTAMSNLTVNESGLILAPIGYPKDAAGVVTDLNSIKDGNIPGFESYATYNPAVVYDEDAGIFHMIYRSELPDKFDGYFGSRDTLGHMSTLSYAYSKDGINYTRGENNPIAWPTTADEAGGGLEDPRMFKIENDPNRGGKTTYYITFTMYDNHVTREGIMYTHDFKTFTKVGRIAPDYDGAIKSGSFVTDPEGNAVMINDPRPGKTGKVYMIYMKDCGYARVGFTKDVLRIEAEDIVDVDTSGFASNNVEALTKGNESCMAITNIYSEDEEDIYIMYGGGVLSDNNIQYEQPNVNGWFYALGAMKLTKSNPFELTNVRLDLDEPSLYPTDTNKFDYGLFNKCMFADTMLRVGNKWYLYYGSGDMYVGLATARADFGAGAVEYELNGTTLTASTYALNKKYGEDKSDWDIKLVSNIYATDGTLIKTVDKAYTVKHFLHHELGMYSRGERISLSVDLEMIPNLPTEYYVETYIVDAETGERLNHVSYYTVVNGKVTHTA